MNRFIIKKTSNTYAESLEAYGLCNILHKILVQINENEVDIIIRDYHVYYEITLIKDEQPYCLKEEQLNGLHYFYLFKFIKKEIDTDVIGISDYYDYARSKMEIDAIKNNEKKKIISEQESRSQQREKKLEVIGPEYNVISLMAGNSFANLENLFLNFHKRQNIFADCIKSILSWYSIDKKYESNFELEKGLKINKMQLYNPSCGKGLNYEKARLTNNDIKNIKGDWICSTLQISGAQTDMMSNFIDKDIKILVPVYSEIKYEDKDKVIFEFRKSAKGYGSIQTDILNALSLTEKLLEHDGLTNRKRKIRTIISGFQIAYQKNLGNQNGITNIGYIGLPEFISISTREENDQWLSFVQEHIKIISSLVEKYDSYGLSIYRDFISDSSIDSFHAFTFWYASHIMSQLSKKKYAESLSITNLNKLYTNMETKDLNLEEIISNDGLQAVADAIRKSTVSLQRTEKSKRNYEVRYGLAQTLQIASSSKEDLATFVANFASTYNAETARIEERNKKNPSKEKLSARGTEDNGVEPNVDTTNGEDSVRESWTRSMLTKEELNSFYKLLSNNSSTLIGGLLGAYGFATKENSQDQKRNRMLNK